MYVYYFPEHNCRLAVQAGEGGEPDRERAPQLQSIPWQQKQQQLSGICVLCGSFVFFCPVVVVVVDGFSTTFVVGVVVISIDTPPTYPSPSPFPSFCCCCCCKRFRLLKHFDDVAINLFMHFIAPKRE